jgi:hypothetical protein
VAHPHATHDGVDLGDVDVDDAADGEPALAEPAVAGEGLAEVAGTDDDDRPVVVETELTPDLVHEVVDLVADTAGAVAAEVRQILADLGGVDAGQLGETLRRDRCDAGVGLLGEDLQVDGQPGHGGFGDPASRHGGRPVRGHRPSPYALRARFHKAG